MPDDPDAPKTETPAQRRQADRLTQTLQLTRMNWELVNSRVDQLARLMETMRQEQETVMSEMRTTMAAAQRYLMGADQETEHLATIADALTRATQEQSNILAYLEAVKTQTQKDQAEE